MNQQEFCQDCHQRHNCQEVYRQLGNAENPPIAFKTIVVFLLPMLIFTVSLAVSGKILAKAGDDSSRFSDELQTFLSFCIALLATFVFVIIVKILEKLIRTSS
jgi:hypothetical protein